MNVLDTSAWLEILTGGPRADRFLAVARIDCCLLVPSLIVAEVVHHVHVHLGDGPAIDALAALSRGASVPFTASMAGATARAAEEFGLSFRNSLIYAQARHCAADLWTMEPAFEPLPGVRYVPRPAPDRPIH